MLVDVASGNGAVIERAGACSRSWYSAITCLDISPSAMRSLTRRVPDIRALVADARAIPLTSGSFDIATSQFGVEYAGLEAVAEVARLVASGGTLAMLLHYRGGGIHRQCRASRDGINEMRRHKVIASCVELFEEGFDAGRINHRDGRSLKMKNFESAVRVMESIMRKHGREVADGTVVRLYRDIRTVTQGYAKYLPSEIVAWLTEMQKEIDAYHERMVSMCLSAVSDSSFDRLTRQIRNLGFIITRNEPLVNSKNQTPLAWALVATKI
jgi:SAM-dependent methyltransferase